MSVLAAVKVSPQTTELKEFDLPDVPEDGGLLKVEMAGVCGSDVGSYHHLERGGPSIMGHENVGYVTAIGRIASKLWGVREGDLIALEEYLPCRHCNWCHEGEYRLCSGTYPWDPNGLRFGHTAVDAWPSLYGGYAQYLYMPTNTVIHPVPEGVSPSIAAMALPLGNGYQWACIEGGAGPGKTVLIQGPGQQGLGCVFAAKRAGADRIIVTGLAKDTFRLQVARMLGADETIDVEKEDPRERLQAITGKGVDIAIDTSSARDKAAIFQLALDALRPKGGVIVSQGGKIPDFSLSDLTQKYATLKSARGHSYKAVEIAMGWMCTYESTLRAMTTHHFGLGEVDKAIRAVGGELTPDAIHVSVTPWAETVRL